MSIYLDVTRRPMSNYNRSFFVNFLREIVIDTETTGLDPLDGAARRPPRAGVD